MRAVLSANLYGSVNVDPTVKTDINPKKQAFRGFS